MTRDETIDRFLENVAAVAAETARVRGRAGVDRMIADLIGGDSVVYCPRLTELERSIALPEDRVTDDYTSASVCVEEVFAGIAETGSLVSTSAGGRAVQGGLVPQHHIALIATDRIVETLDHFFSQWGDGPPTNITLETGPSRTADIELTLTIGVHGPGRLSVIAVEE
ncbi:MAG: lactate utilization protein [Desulfomonile sp.]|nr:lactate utilization protein [Desulfomonile sp.]